MSTHPTRKSPLLHRMSIGGFSVLLTLLFIWLLGFVVNDVGDLEQPDVQALEEQYLDRQLIERKAGLEKQRDELKRQIENQREVQTILQTSTQNSQQTMNQLLEFNRLSIEKGVTPTEEEQAALAESQRLFLENQSKFQDANQTIAQLSDNQRTIEDEITTINNTLQEQRIPLNVEYRRMLDDQRFTVAVIKLLILIPLLIISAWLVLKNRGTAYSPIYYAAFIAIFWRTGLVMHEYFPRAIFKYLLIGASIAVVLAFLIHLIRKSVAPKTDWLLKQFKESYNKNRCPACSYPIHHSGKRPRKKPRRLPIPATYIEEDLPAYSYSCPACGTKLYEECEECKNIRHALLPYCERCGKEKGIAVT